MCVCVFMVLCMCLGPGLGAERQVRHSGAADWSEGRGRGRRKEEGGVTAAGSQRAAAESQR